MLINVERFIEPGARVAVFFLCPYATPIKKLGWAVRSLQRAGYSVIAYEYSRAVFSGGETDQLFTAIEETREDIKASIKELQGKGYNEFGFVGSSLGSFVAVNCLGIIPELDWGVFNTGGNIAEAIWNFETERRAFESKGFTRQGLEKAWHSLQYPAFGDLTGKRYIAIASKGDETVDYKGAVAVFDLIEAAGPDTTVLMHRRLGHRATIARNLFRVRKLVKKVRA